MNKVIKTYTANARTTKNHFAYFKDMKANYHNVILISIMIFAITLIVALNQLPEYIPVIIVIYLTIAGLSIYNVKYQEKSILSWYKAQNHMVNRTVEISDEGIVFSTDDLMTSNISWNSLRNYSNKTDYFELWIIGMYYRINKKFLNQEEIDTIKKILDRQMELKRVDSADNQPD